MAARDGRMSGAFSGIDTNILLFVFVERIAVRRRAKGKVAAAPAADGAEVPLQAHSVRVHRPAAQAIAVFKSISSVPA
ncbi:MAG: hypothetical protein ACRETW_13565 [Stenotrophobium sp.]